MSDKENDKAQELIDNINQAPQSAQDYLRGYLQGQIDAFRTEGKE